MRLLLSALLLAAVHPAQAQLTAGKQPKQTDLITFSLSVFGSVPMGDFRQHENGGGGADVSLGYQPFRRQPLVLRAQAAGMLYDGASATGFQDVCDEEGACWTERASYKARSHSMMMLHAGPEIMATDGTWRPFGYAMAGWTWFRSSARVPAESPSSPDPGSFELFSSRNVSSVYGAGIRRVGTRIGREAGFEFSARYVRNANAAYLTESDVVRGPDGNFVASPRNGDANLLGLHLGFWIGPHVNWGERR